MLLLSKLETEGRGERRRRAIEFGWQRAEEATEFDRVGFFLRPAGEGGTKIRRWA